MRRTNREGFIEDSLMVRGLPIHGGKGTFSSIQKTNSTCISKSLVQSMRI